MSARVCVYCVCMCLYSIAPCMAGAHNISVTLNGSAIVNDSLVSTFIPGKVCELVCACVCMCACVASNVASL